MQEPVATWDGQRDCWILEKPSERKKTGLYEHWGVFSGTFPNQGTMRNGQLYPHPRQVPRTYGSGSSSLLPSPVANPSGNTAENHLRKKPGRTQVTDLRIIVEENLLPTGGKLLPTLQARDYKDTTLKPATHRPEDVSNVTRAPAHASSDFGPYREAIERWEDLTRPVPSPTEPNRNGNPALSADFCEWMMGLPEGHIQGTRGQRIKQAGNGVVVAQAELALRRMLNGYL